MTSTPDAVLDSNKIPFSKVMETHAAVLRDLFDWLVQPCLDFIRHECKLFITTSPLHLVHSLLNLFTCIMDDFITSSSEGGQIQQKQVCS